MVKNKASNAFFIAVVVSIILPFVPVLHWGLLPFDYLNTHLHEMFHALAALLTGGEVSHIIVNADSSGVTWTRGGIQPVIQMAGYLGASLFGSAMVQSCRNEKSSKIWLRVLGGLILLTNVLWVRGDAIGLSLGIAWCAAILFMSGKLKGDNLLFAAQFLAVQQCLNSLKSLRDLVMLSGSNVATDAQLLASDTHIPAIVWAVIWAGVSIFGIGMAMVRISKVTKTT